MRKLCLLLTTLLVTGIEYTGVMAQQKIKHPVPVILDTDIGPDYDDVGAMALLHALADKGEAKPLAVMASNRNPLVAPVINLLNIYFGRPHLPVGATKAPNAPNEQAVQGWPKLLLDKYAHTIKSTDDAPDAITLYRKILSTQPDNSVTIITIGFLTNLQGLLNSQPDQYSGLEGKTLIAKKVKQLVSMAGRFPGGREYNVLIDSVASEKVFAGWPTPVLYSGFEIGEKIITGRELTNNAAIQNSPVKDAYTKAMAYHANDRNGRNSWDQTAVLVAIRGISPYYTVNKGEIIIKGGNNEWKNDPKGKQAYLVAALPAKEIRAEIENLMMHQPVTK
ncbi:MAG: nucleoside hydrolase [Agriterribacter sp.]